MEFSDPGFQGVPPVDALAHLLLEAELPRHVIGPALEALGHRLHVRRLHRAVVSVLVALAVADLLHQRRHGVPDLERDRLVGALLDLALDGTVGGVDAVALRRRGEVNDRLGQGQLPLRRAEKIVGFFGVQGQGQGLRVGQADVLGGETDHAPGDVERILARRQHPDEPVERGVDVAVTEALVEGRDEVEVLFPGFVVEEGPLLKRFLHVLDGDELCPGQAGGDLEGVQGPAGVAVGVVDEHVPGARVDGQPGRAESAILVLEGVPDDLAKGLLAELLQDENPGPRQQRGDDFEGGVFRRRPEEDDVALFHVRQKGRLLGLVEAVDLVDEQDHGLAEKPSLLFGPGHELLDLLDPGKNGAEELEGQVEVSGQHHAQGRLARARRTPEDDGNELVRLDELGQELALAQDVVLAVDAVEGPGPHPLGERRPGALVFVFLLRVGWRHRLGIISHPARGGPVPRLDQTPRTC